MTGRQETPIEDSEQSEGGRGSERDTSHFTFNDDEHNLGNLTSDHVDW